MPSRTPSGNWPVGIMPQPSPAATAALNPPTVGTWWSGGPAAPVPSPPGPMPPAPEPDCWPDWPARHAASRLRCRLSRVPNSCTGTAPKSTDPSSRRYRSSRADAATAW
ncbi:hypothetical protein ACFFX0_16045 [Citricoccus parietis]|uniref:Uncharacterized protein n=1 Tax=Citricoccus parietis TaxID=592307 RepID=A0ABV5G2D0_9MICC